MTSGEALDTIHDALTWIDANEMRVPPSVLARKAREALAALDVVLAELAESNWCERL